MGEAELHSTRRICAEIEEAKRPETREKRVAQMLENLRMGTRKK